MCFNDFSPLTVAKQTAENLLWSTLFMAGYSAIWRYLLCVIKNIRGKEDGLNIYIDTICASLAILFEPKHRRIELSYYLIPKTLEAIWLFLENRGLTVHIKHWEVIIFAFAMGIIYYFYNNEDKNIKPTYLGLFKKLWGNN